MNKEKLNEITAKILDAAIEVHRNLGPGLLESVYEECLEEELRCRSVDTKSQMSVPIVYKGRRLNKEFRIDLLIEKEVIVELKTVDKLAPIHEAQLLTYLKLANKKVGILINFNEVLLKNGYKRMLNGNLPEI